MRRLVVTPHADDEVMGCGGLIAKHRDVDIVVVTTVDEVRDLERQRAWKELGWTGRHFDLGLPDGRAGEDMPLLVGLLDELVSTVTPHEVFLPYPGSHQDHIATYEAGVRACRQSLSPDHWMPGTVLVYETPPYDIDLQTWPLRFALFEALTAEHATAKADAMRAYESQCLKPHPGSPSHLYERARALGVARDLEFAEQYAVVRMVRP